MNKGFRRGLINSPSSDDPDLDSAFVELVAAAVRDNPLETVAIVKVKSAVFPCVCDDRIM